MTDEITWCTADKPCEDCRRLKLERANKIFQGGYDGETFETTMKKIGDEITKSPHKPPEVTNPSGCAFSVKPSKEFSESLFKAGSDYGMSPKESPHKTPQAEPKLFPPQHSNRVCGKAACWACDEIDRKYEGLILSDQTIESRHKSLLTQQEPPEPSPQHPTDIASQVGKFFEQLQEQAPDLVRSYLLHLEISQLDRRDLRSKASALLDQLPACHAKTPSQSADPSSSRWLRGGETEPYDLDTEGEKS